MILIPEKSRLFYGWKCMYYAKRYAAKRHKNWSDQYDQKGKHQGVFDLTADGDDNKTFMVLSALEIKYYKKRKMIHNQQSFNKIFKRESIWNTLNQ